MDRVGLGGDWVGSGLVESMWLLEKGCLSVWSE